MRSTPRSRRTFLKELSLGFGLAPFILRGAGGSGPAGKIRHASFGTSGMAWTDLTAIASHPSVEVVAGCDVDERATVKFREKFPQARVYRDYRELLEKEKDLQTVNVSTPDHMHAPIGMASLERGLHVYGQKPLTHDLFEARRLSEFARTSGCQTQMGIQIHSSKEYRTAVDLIQQGAIGKVKEVHTWSSKKWGDLQPMPASTDGIPSELDWNLWLGVCAERPFIGGWYHPGQWRKRLDFGTGTFGDMGCHIYDPVFKALALTAPLKIRSEGAAPNQHSWATDALIHYTFPGTAFTDGPTVQVTWYDGDRRPSEEIQAFGKLGTMADGKPAVIPDQGSIFIGSKGVMVLPHVGMPRLVAGAELKFEATAGANHWHQFIDAAMGTGTPGAHFGYAGPLTEAVLLGSVASRFPQVSLEWDGPGLRFKNLEAANEFVRREYRKF